MNYRETLAWLYGTQLFGIKLGLENIQRLLEALGLSAPDARIIHVAGTNGKGSVCAMIESVARAEGYRTGLFTSPHLVTFRERIRVNGVMIPEAAVVRGLTTIREAIAGWEPAPTFFEIVTALALMHFREDRADVVVLETGMGGRLDATNALQPLVSVITPIALDHQKWLGETIEKIAHEKAGIIKSGIPVVAAPQSAETKNILVARANECDVPIEFITREYAGAVALHGAHQKQNAALALAALRAGVIDVSDMAIRRGLAQVAWPARFQRWGTQIVIDGAHNPAGARILAETWRAEFGEERATIIFAALADKEVNAMCRALAPIAARVFLPRIRSARAFSPNELFGAWKLAGISRDIVWHTSLADSIAEAQQREEKILITGSLHFAGEVLAHLRGEPAAYEECSQ